MSGIGMESWRFLWKSFWKRHINSEKTKQNKKENENTWETILLFLKYLML